MTREEYYSWLARMQTYDAYTKQKDDLTNFKIALSSSNSLVANMAAHSTPLPAHFFFDARGLLNQFIEDQIQEIERKMEEL